MNFLLAFVFAGFVCMLGQIILDNTKLTPGHITSLFTVVGAILSSFGCYGALIEKFGAGATLMISNFGHMLYQSSLQGYMEEGFIGIFSGMFVKSSLALAAVIVFSFIFALVFKPKD